MGLAIYTRGQELGGVETVVRDLILGLGTRCAHVLCPPGPVQHWLAERGIHTTPPPLAPGQWLTVHAPHALLLTCPSGLGLAALCRQRGIPVVWMYHAPQRRWLEERGALAPLFAAVDTVVMPSQYLRRELGAPPSVNCQVIPNGIDTDRFQPRARCPIRNRLGWDARHFVLAYSARFEQRKRHDLLLRSFAAFQRDCPEARLLLIGRDDRQGILPSTSAATLALIQALNLGHAVRWVSVPPDHVPQWLGVADLFCFPPRGEAQGCALLEALALNLPVIAVKAEGVAELFAQGAPGWTTAPDTPRSLHQLMHLARRHFPALTRLAQNGRPFVQRRHSVQAMVQQYAAVLTPCRGAS